MSLFDKVRTALSSGPAKSSGAADDFHQVRVRCQRCGEVLSARVSLKNDLSIDYERNVYHVRKLIMGSGQNRCFQQIETRLTFDAHKQLLDREISGGAFVDEEN